IGAFLALLLTGQDLSMLSMIGLIMLMGLVVKNSILLIDFAKRLQRTGMDKHAALQRAGMIRVRPIMMTTLALICGAIPSAIGIGWGAERRRPLSVVVIGGVLTSFILTLLVVPTAYSLLEGVRARLSQLFRRQPGMAAPQPALALPGAAAGNSTSHQPGQHDGALQTYFRPSGSAGTGGSTGAAHWTNGNELTPIKHQTATNQRDKAWN